MPVSRPPGSVRGVLSNGHPYRDKPTLINQSGNAQTAELYGCGVSCGSRRRVIGGKFDQWEKRKGEGSRVRGCHGWTVPARSSRTRRVLRGAGGILRNYKSGSDRCGTACVARAAAGATLQIGPAFQLHVPVGELGSLVAADLYVGDHVVCKLRSNLL